jgi:hypothetical protein
MGVKKGIGKTPWLLSKPSPLSPSRPDASGGCHD